MDNKKWSEINQQNRMRTFESAESADEGVAEIPAFEKTQTIFSNELQNEILNAARAEIQNDLEKMERREEYVGDESALQVQERLAEDLADAQMEFSPETQAERNTVHTQEQLGRLEQKEIEELMRQPSFKPGELDAKRKLGMHKMLRLFGRTLGENN